MMDRRSDSGSYAWATASGASSRGRPTAQSGAQAPFYGSSVSDMSSAAFASLMNESLSRPSSLRGPGRTGDSSLQQSLLRPPAGSRGLSHTSRATGSSLGASSSVGTDSDMSDSEFEALLAESVNYRGPRLDRPSGSLPEARHAQSTSMTIPARRGGGAAAVIGGSIAGTSLLAQFFSDPEARARADAAHPTLSKWQREQARRARGMRSELRAAPSISAAPATGVADRSSRPRAASMPRRGVDPFLAQIRLGRERATSVPARRQDVSRDRAPLVAQYSVARQSSPLPSASPSTSSGARRFSVSQPGALSYAPAPRSLAGHMARPSRPELSPARMLVPSPSPSPARNAQAAGPTTGALFSRLSSLASLCFGRRKTPERRPLLSRERRGRTTRRGSPATYTQTPPGSRAPSARPPARTPSPTLESIIAQHREAHGTF